MTFINHLIAQAKQHPEEIVVEKRRVHEIAYHAQQVMLIQEPLSQISDSILRGEAKILGVPIRVKGHG